MPIKKMTGMQASMRILENLTIHAKPKGMKIKGCRVSKSLILKKNQLWVPDNKSLQLEILKEIHN